MDLPEKMNWFHRSDICPYVFVRPENQVLKPGALHAIDWFDKTPIHRNPMLVSEVNFANAIYELEGKAFDSSGMAMPRWVFYDCGILPGFVAGFAARARSLSPSVQAVLKPHSDLEWVPISLFIIIPTIVPNEWVAHNLSSVNALVAAEQRLYGLGFMTKAFGLWYANVRNLIGATQWSSPALRLHVQYGDFEVMTAFTPIHSYARTLTYRVQVNPGYWSYFTQRSKPLDFQSRFKAAGFSVAANNQESLMNFQNRMEKGEGPFYLDPEEVRKKSIGAPLSVYKLL